MNAPLRTERRATSDQAALIATLYRQLDPTHLDPELCDALAAAATEPPLPRAVRQVTRRFAKLDTALAAADGPIDTVRTVFDAIRALLRHVPAAEAERVANTFVAVGRREYDALLVARAQRWEPGQDQDVASWRVCRRNVHKGT